MRVLHLCAGNLFGGIERFLVGLAQLQRTHVNADHRFLLTHEGRLSKELIAAGSIPYKTPAEPRISRPWTVVRTQAFVREVLAEIHPDAVISHGAWAHAVLGATVPARIPRIFFLHGAASGHWLERLAALRPPTQVLTNSEYSRKTLHAIFPRTPSRVVRFVLPDQAALGSRERVRSSMGVTSKVVLVQVSRLERGKGHTLLLDALAQMRRSRPWVLWIVGGAQRPSEVRYLEQLRRRTTALGLIEHVDFLGERSDVPELLSAADIFCHTNITPEGLGLSIIEALSAGLPIVSTYSGGPSEYLDANCAVLLENLDSRQLALRLEGLVDDDGSRKSMSQEARRLYEREFDPVLCETRFSETLERVVHSSEVAGWA
jgi:glycosyltransferase involved in cell wall biosynthesis